MRRAGRWCVATLVSVAVGVTPRAVVAQAQPAPSTALQRAINEEEAGKWREAAASYRVALHDGLLIPAMLGLERALSQLGEETTLLSIVDSLLLTHPRDPMIRTVQLRTLRAVGRDDALRAAFEQWAALSPRDVAPWREYARTLLGDGRTAAADSLLKRAELALGRSRELLLESAQLRAALGQWESAATAWRDGLVDQPWMDQAAVFSLGAAPIAQRDPVRRVLGGAPVDRGARAVLARLELQWNAPRDGWRALESLRADDSTLVLWRSFADEVERSGAWLVARDAWAAVDRAKPDPTAALRAATAALTGGDAAGALTILGTAMRRDSLRLSASALPVRVRALAQLARPAEAEALIAGAGLPDSPDRRTLMRTVAWGWIRAGDVERARATIAGGGSAADEDAVSAWLALVDGDLTAARRGLRESASTGARDAVDALALLSRTRATRSTALGRTFLALAQGDTLRAARSFALAVDSLTDGAGVTLATSARLALAAHDDALAESAWARLVRDFPSAPEAVEAELTVARRLVVRGDRVGAAARYEHLILTWPESALLPQARRELETLRRSAP
ncbi:MAG: hypothetical protein K2X99_02595 [Gemmatimonadaceae bacterium]|nr:hypothetical protein [Gemmatimonadaceae bacterium]